MEETTDRLMLNVPHAIRDIPGWLLWKYETEDGKLLKKPYYATTKKERKGTQGALNDRANLVTFKTAMEAFQEGGFDGVGIATLPDFGIVAGDFDAKEGKTLHDDAMKLANTTYAEKSPSGKGIRALWLGSMASKKNNAIGVEVFGSTGFVTITGNVINDLEPEPLPAHVRQRLEALTGGAAVDAPPAIAGTRMADPKQVAELRSALEVLPADDYHQWVNFGNALVELGKDGFSLWDEWSQKSSKYNAAEAMKKWRSFKGGAFQLESIFFLAQAAGWVNAGRNSAKIDAIDPAVEKLPEVPPPYPGAMAEIVEASLKSAFKPQPALATLAALVGMAACINGEYSTHSGGRFNLYGVGVLESGGGKDNPRVIGEMVAAMGKASILGRPASGAGLEDVLEARKNQLVSIDEMAHILQAMNDDRSPAHLRDIAAAMLKLYSASGAAYNRRILSSGGQKRADFLHTSIPNPCISVLGFATPSGLGKAFTEANFVDGLMGRILMVTGNSTVEPRRPHHAIAVPASVLERMERFKPIDPLATVAPAGLGSCVVGEAEGVPERLDALMVALEKDRAGTEHEVTRSLYRRSFEKLERIAGVLAIWENPEAPVKTLAHVEWARQMVLACDAHMLNFVSQNMFSSDVTKDAARIRKIILRIQSGEIKPQRNCERNAIACGNVARSHLLRASKLDKAGFDRAVSYMQDRHELVAFGGDPCKPLPEIQKIDLDND